MNAMMMNGATGVFTSVRKPRWFALATLIGILPLLLLQSGCGTSRPFEKAPIVLYETVSPASHPVFPDVVRAAADRAPSIVTFDPDAAGSSDYRLDLNFTIRNKGLHDTETIWTMTTILLLTMYPATCGHFELTLSGDLYGPDGGRLRTWEIVEQDTAFVWLFQGDDCGDEPATDSIREAAANMLDKLYTRMSLDGAFSGRLQGAASNLPLVYVNAVNAQELVHKVLKTDAPFPNYTTDAAFADMAARSVNIEYEFIQPDQGLGSAMGKTVLSIWTIGLVSMCPKNLMILNAIVSDADGSVLGTYRLTKKKRAAMSNYCAPATDETHPDLAAKLLRQLLAQMQNDKLV